jgi:Ca2+-binding EF-hand superfamily protein
LGEKIEPELKEIKKRKLSDPEILKVESELRVDVLDSTGNGVIEVSEIHEALKNILNVSVHDDNMILAEHIHSIVDINDDGKVTQKDFENICKVESKLSNNIRLFD